MDDVADNLKTTVTNTEENRVDVVQELHVPKDLMDHFNRIGYEPNDLKLAMQAIGPILGALGRGDLRAQLLIARSAVLAVQAAMKADADMPHPDSEVYKK